MSALRIVNVCEDDLNPLRPTRCSVLLRKIEMASSDSSVTPFTMRTASQGAQKAFTYIRTEQGTFICPTCGVTKQRQNSMHYHMKKHQQDPNHTCQYCNKTFLQKQTLELHLRTKHTDRLVEDGVAGAASASGFKPSYSCPISGCDYQSHTKGNCVIHCLRVHFQEEITPHLRVVQDRRVYSCGHCLNEFQSTTAFYYHIKSCITFDQTTPKYRELQGLLES